MDKCRPLLICMTPVRNEAWVLNAFLKATSLWADYIIIADQMSTDGSREIALNYPKVILIDNDNPDFNEAERQKMLIDRAREIKGDKILFGLDADEIFAANFQQTEDWKKILNSKSGDVFWFKWALICPDQVHYWDSETFFPWVFHDDGKEPHENYVRNMHSMRIPYPIDEQQLNYVNDFKVLHFVTLHVKREISKRRFYKIVDFNLNKRTIIQISRTYASRNYNDDVLELPREWTYNIECYKFDLFSEIDLSENEFWFDKYVVKHINLNPKRVSKIDIWDKNFLDNNNILDQRSWFYKLIHWYLKSTNGFSDFFIVKIIDWLIIKVER